MAGRRDVAGLEAGIGGNVRPPCNDCGTRLDRLVENDKTLCPKCGRWWELTQDRQHINITLVVQDVTHRNVSIIGRQHNG